MSGAVERRGVFHVTRCKLRRSELQPSSVDSSAGAVQMHVQRSLRQRGIARTPRPHGITRVGLNQRRPKASCTAPWVIKPRVAVEPFPTIEYAAPHTTKFSSSRAAGRECAVGRPAQRVVWQRRPREPAIESQVHPVVHFVAFAPPEEALRIVNHAGAVAQLNQAKELSTLVPASRIASEKSTTSDVVVLSLMTMFPLNSVPPPPT